MIAVTETETTIPVRTSDAGRGLMYASVLCTPFTMIGAFRPSIYPMDARNRNTPVSMILSPISFRNRFL